MANGKHSTQEVIQDMKCQLFGDSICHVSERGSNDSCLLSLHLQVNSATQKFADRNTNNIEFFCREMI